MHAKCITITKANMQYFEDYMYGILWNTMIRANEFHLNKECLEYLGVMWVFLKYYRTYYDFSKIFNIRFSVEKFIFLPHMKIDF